jgi:hypothetical protein
MTAIAICFYYDLICALIEMFKHREAMGILPMLPVLKSVSVKLNRVGRLFKGKLQYYVADSC